MGYKKKRFIFYINIEIADCIFIDTLQDSKIMTKTQLYPYNAVKGFYKLN